MEAVIGAVMAGGAASRMGGDKALVQLNGRPLISYPLEAFADSGIEAVVVAKHHSRLPPVAVPIWHEPDEPSHPLRGIVTALERSKGRPVIACACDMPFLSPALLSYLSERDESLVVPRASGRLHPLIARYDASFLDAFRNAADSGRALHDAIAELAPAIVDEPELRRFGDPARLLFNVNTRDDLARAEEMARG